jgi:HK97 gp10 family phage protein
MVESITPKEFQKRLLKIANKTKDLSGPLRTIGQAWFQSNKSLFKRSGPGRFVDLSTKPFIVRWRSKAYEYGDVVHGGYKEYKKKEHGKDPYPILRLFGRLEKSITDSKSSEAIFKVGKLSLILGTKTPYAGFLHYGTRKMKARPFVLYGNEQVRPEPWNKNDVNVRLALAIKSIEKYVLGKLK